MVPFSKRSSQFIGHLMAELRFVGSPEAWAGRNLHAIRVLLRLRLDICDRKWHLRKYKNCFVASRCIDLLVEVFKIPDRDLAQSVGEFLRVHRVIEHVIDKNKPFKDKLLFFRLVDSESETSTSSEFCIEATLARSASADLPREGPSGHSSRHGLTKSRSVNSLRTTTKVLTHSSKKHTVGTFRRTGHIKRLTLEMEELMSSSSGTSSDDCDDWEDPTWVKEEWC